MPLISIEGSQAFDNLANNPAGRWPNRADGSNRIEPLAKPGFQPSFRLEPKEMVFTIGSCFARNVEMELERLGFSVPMRHIKLSDESGSVDNNQQIFNNYGVASIFNELQWALDPDCPFDAETGLLESAPGRFLDLHLSQLPRAVSRDSAIERRRRLTKALGSAAKCRVVIMTLGLVEVWWDAIAGRYLNVAPPKQFVRQNVGRFSLHVLSYGEVASYLHRTVELLAKHGVPGHKIILTVSPVPLGATFTTQDVAVANAYSKSVLRAASEEITRAYDHIDYFPSYESVLLTERSAAWMDDLVHVTPRIVALNVARMVSAYVPSSVVDEVTIEDAADAERQKLWSRACDLYRRILELEPESTAAKLGLARSLGGEGDYAGAMELLAALENDSSMRAAVFRAKVQIIRLNSRTEEFEGLEPPAGLLRNVGVLSEMAECAFRFGMLERVKGYAKQLASIERVSAQGILWAGRAALEEGRYEEAVRLLQQASSIMKGSVPILVFLAEALMRKGDTAAARSVYERVMEMSPDNASAQSGLQKLASLEQLT